MSKWELLSFAPSPCPLPPLGEEDKGEGENVKPVIVPLFMRMPII
jgi:hypothetical protein